MSAERTARTDWIMRDMPSQERPRERMIHVGAERLGTHELLAILLGTGGRGRSAVIVADRLLAHFGHLRGLARASVEEIAGEPGIGQVKALRVKAALELAVRLSREGGDDRPQLRSPQAAAALVMDEMRLLDKELVQALLVDVKSRLMHIHSIAMGDLTSAPVHPREVFKEAIRRSCSAMILVHNHPSGDPTPSEEDISLTERLVEGGRLLGIEVLDHIVIGEHSFVSMKEFGMFPSDANANSRWEWELKERAAKG